LENLGLNLGYILLQICAFGIVFVVIRAWIYRPVLEMLKKRRETVAKGLEDARVAAEARANAEKEASKILSEAQSKAAQMIREATERAELSTRDVRVQAEAEVARLREQALAEAEKERTRLLGELRSEVTALAIAAAQKIIGEALDEKRQHALLDEFFSGVKNGRVVVLEGASLSGGSAEITSALPLTSAEQGSVKSSLGSDVSVSFRVDPAILGGLILRVGDKVIDSSVAGQLQGLRQNLR
jgi:F-type H+-transporting ATPase subunit b